MAPSTPVSSDASSLSSRFYKSPPPKQPLPVSVTPPVPPPPPPPLLVPGPNAFAHLFRRDRSHEDHEMGTGVMSPARYPVRGSFDSDGNPFAPTLSAQAPRIGPSHRRAHSSTDESSSHASERINVHAAPSDPHITSADVAAAKSTFFRQLKQARERLDETVEEHDTALSTDMDLELTPLPELRFNTLATHRAAVDGRKELRLRQLIQNQGALPQGPQIANIHGDDSIPPARSAALPKPVPVTLATARRDRSPKRNIFNKLGLGVKIAPTELDEHGPSSGFASLQNVPPKAAQVLGTRSLPTRDRAIEAGFQSHNDDLRETADTDLRTTDAAASSGATAMLSTRWEPSRQHTRAADEADVSRTLYEQPPPRSPLRRECRHLPEKHSQQGGNGCLPTTSSKNVLDEHGRGQKSSPAASASSRSGDYRANTNGSKVRAGHAGFREAANVRYSPAVSSLYGAVDGVDSPPLLSRRNIPVRTASGSKEVLPQTTYRRKSTHRWNVSSPHASQETLRPIATPLTHRSRLSRQYRLYVENEVDQFRKSSNSTSASVPLFLEDPSLSGAAFGGGTEMSSRATGVPAGVGLETDMLCGMIEQVWQTLEGQVEAVEKLKSQTLVNHSVVLEKLHMMTNSIDRLTITNTTVESMCNQMQTIGAAVKDVQYQLRNVAHGVTRASMTEEMASSRSSREREFADPVRAGSDEQNQADDVAPHELPHQERTLLKDSKGQRIQRVDTLPLFGSSPLRSRDNVHTTCATDFCPEASADVVAAGNTHGMRDIRDYLQSVPQSAETNASLRGGTWGRKVAREKFERWTG